MARLIDADTLKESMTSACNIFEAHGIDTMIARAVISIIDGIACVDSDSLCEWISVKDRLPAETHSIFWPWYGRKEWRNAMWREQSDKVLVTVTFEDGTRRVTTGETHDGEWNTTISKALNQIVTHWMPLPEPPKEDDDETD
jgi:hypothetical protein